LKGANAMDKHFVEERESLHKNLPALLGLFGVWNSTFLGRTTRALIPYCEALCRFPAHVQQLDMESNGKSVSTDGTLLPFRAGEIDFGEPGTNAQHSFFQLIHQGRVIPVDFIGYTDSQLLCGVKREGKEENIMKLIESNHYELMSNYFAQADALAFGKDRKETEKENAGSNSHLIPHKHFSGNRPSTLILFDGALNAFNCGQLLSLYEHRTAVQGFIWQINSFDQWGVELGKVLGKKVRTSIDDYVRDKKLPNEYNYATFNSLQHYLTKQSKI